MARERNHSGESLFERIAGLYGDGTSVDAVPVSQRRAKSIADHLHRMFNTRQGSIPHLPDYGLPDISEIYRNLPSSLKDLEELLVLLTNKYEPRLERVRVRPVPTNPHEFKLTFEMAAVIKGGERILFKTSFASTGETDVEALGRMA
jgi:type VI secretion system protein